jgi:hypothetical protein
MRLFAWESTYLKGYRAGLMVVEAQDADHARRKLRIAFEKDVRSRHFLPDDLDDDYWTEEYDSWKAKFEADIAKEPRTPGVIFMYGGD